MSTLTAKLRRRIAASGPLSMADYMAAALGDPEFGYYRRNDPLGADGDFTTAPEISQLFGELIGAWLIDCWAQMGRPEKINLVELGPGRGTLMQDALRIGRHAPDWLAVAELHLVDINPRLRQLQAERLSDYSPTWHGTLSDIPEGPLLLVANEFLDALPIRQLVFWKGAWRERLVGWNAESGFHFVLSQTPNPLSILIPAELSAPTEGSVFELSTAAIGVTDEITRRIVKFGGAALIVDYGRAQSETGQSLQAVRRHEAVKLLENPGDADLSAHVDFGMVRRSARESGANVFGPIPQGQFLKALGIAARADQLKQRATEDQALAIDQALHRLIDPSAMGELFKVLSLASANLNPAGFNDCAI